MINRFLIQVTDHKDRVDLIAHGNYLNQLTVSADTVDDCLALLRDVLNSFLDIRGMAWISKWKRQGSIITCPEAYIDLPIDLWKCKLNKMSCGLQAQVDVYAKIKFLKHCHAPRDRKLEIFNTIASGRYNGFHHIPGRYLCVQCAHNKEKYKYDFYHYPWELINVTDVIAQEYDSTLKIRKQLIKNDINPSVAHSATCANCTKQIINKISPKLSEKFFVLDIDFFGR